jgi:uncharacterized protein (DUF885 family)
MKPFWSIISGAFLSFLGLAAKGDVSPERTPDQELNQFFKAHLDRDFKERPLEATRLGDHRFDHLLDDVSPKARAGWLARNKTVLAQLAEKFAKAKLSSKARIDFEIFRHNLRRDIWLAENTKPFEEDPRVYNDYLTESIYLLLTQSTLPKAKNIKNAAMRISQLPKIVEAAKSSLGNPPRVFVETAIKQNRGAIDFYKRGVFELAGEAAPSSELKAPAAKAVTALEAYQTFLEKTLLPRANGNWRLGKEKFARKLELELDAGLTSAEVLNEALAEFARVQRELYTVAKQLWARTHPGVALPPDDDAGRRETVRRVFAQTNRDHGKAQDMVKDAGAIADRIKTFIDKKDIMRLPKPDRCRIVEMPEFQRGNTTAYLNPAPALDPKAASYYAISPPPREWDARKAESYLQEYNKHMLQILTIHEAYPGHYVQLEYSNRNPSLIRKVLSSGVFAEGWAVYTEQMMLDQGYGDGDLALRLNQLKFYLRAVANSLLDFKMHCTKMTDKEALDFLVKDCYQSEGEALGKIIRAKQSSCQLSTYFVGRTAFYRLRQKVQREMGDKFSLGRYHEAVLDHGTLPVKYLPALVRERLKKPR